MLADLITLINSLPSTVISNDQKFDQVCVCAGGRGRLLM